MQYLITGGALAGSVLVLVACCSAISYAIKRRKQKGLSPTDISIQSKYLDTSRQISLMQNHQHNTLPASTHNDVLMQRQSQNNLTLQQQQQHFLTRYKALPTNFFKTFKIGIPIMQKCCTSGILTPET